MTIQDTSLPIWIADFKPRATRPKDVRKLLNACVRNEFETETGWVNELTRGLHSLAVVIPDVAIVSSCKNYVAVPAKTMNTLVIDVRKVVTDTSEAWKNSKAFADAIPAWEADNKPHSADRK